LLTIIVVLVAVIVGLVAIIVVKAPEASPLIMPKSTVALCLP